MPSSPLAMSAIHTSAPFMHSPLAHSPLSPLSPISENEGMPLPPKFNRTPSFPTSRPLRPFPTLSNARRNGSAAKSVKMIEPPQGFSSSFVLNLTQDEFSRR